MPLELEDFVPLRKKPNMTEFLTSETGWLSVTNISLGVAVIVCLVAVGRVIIQDLRARAVARRRLRNERDRSELLLSSLGITMADGGEPIDENLIKAQRRPPEEDDPPNVIRSDN